MPLPLHANPRPSHAPSHASSRPCYPAAPHLTPQALAASDPDALSSLEGFTLSRRGVGSLRWLVPVDVRGLELDQIARIDQGEMGQGGRHG